MGMDHQALEAALVEQGKVNLEQRAEITRLTAERDAALAFARRAAAQELSDEMDEDTREHADWEGGLERLVTEARALIQQSEGCRK